MISPNHLAMLAASGITEDFALARGYETITDPQRLINLVNGKGITRKGCNVPGLLVPLLDKRGSTWGWQYRPDNPRRDAHGKPIKYETPTGQRNGLDIPPGIGPRLDDPNEPVFIVEGSKKADAAALAGLCAVSVSGVWCWKGQSTAGGKSVALPEWADIARNRRFIISFDGDVACKEGVQKAMHALAAYLATKGGRVEYLHLPDTTNKTGLDDYLADGHTADDVWRLVKPVKPPTRQSHNQPPHTPPKPPPPQPISLEEAHKVFTKWLGDKFDTEALDIELAAAAVEQLDGDPVWLMYISGSGAAKTETVQPLAGIRATITSAITSAGALLSATSAKEKTADATGGLLRKLGDRGVLVIKDFTTILSMDRNARAEVLAALREIYDGYWARNVGTDGGKTLEWSGRLVVIGACTTAWDRAHIVISMMGNRFVLVRIDSEDENGREESGLQSILNLGSEATMRTELAAAVAGVIAGMTQPAPVTSAESLVLVRTANLATRTRSAVDVDYRGDVEDAHAPESPTRFAKQLTQVVRGARAIGVGHDDALRLAIRCSRDSLPPLRLAILEDLADNSGVVSTAVEVARRIDKPRTTVDRQLQALHALGIATVKPRRSPWEYSLRAGIDPTVLDPKSLPEMLVKAHKDTKKREASAATPHLPLPTFLVRRRIPPRHRRSATSFRSRISRTHPLQAIRTPTATPSHG
jgi:hypothetical protein